MSSLAPLVVALILGQVEKDTPPPPPLPPEPAEVVAPYSQTTLEPPAEQSSDDLAGMLDNTLKRLARIANQAALRRFRQKDYPGALKGFQEAYELDPTDPEISNNLAYLYQLLGNHAQAEHFYRKTLELEPQRVVANLNLADLLAKEDASVERLVEAADLLTRARELRGNDPRLIIRQARVAGMRSSFTDAERFYREYLATTPATDALRLELGDLYRDFGHDEDALSWYREIEEKGRYGPAAARRIFELEVAREARRLGWVRPSSAVPVNVRVLATRGRVARGEGRYEEAERLLRQAIGIAPGFALARADLAELLAEQNRDVEAELAFLRALAVAPGNAEVRVRLAEFYAEQGDRAAEAALMLERALELRPDWTELYLRLAEAHREAGELTQSLVEVRRYLAQASSDEDRERARALEQALAPLVLLAQSSEPTTSPAPPASRPRRVVEALTRARTFLARGEPEAAMAELRSLPASARGPEVLNVEGRVLFAAGQLPAAAAAYEASLAKKADQPAVHEQLGLVFEQLGRADAARMQLRGAEALGSRTATYHLARLDVAQAGDGRSWLGDVSKLRMLRSARDRLESFILQAGGGVYRAEGEALLERVERRLRRVLFAGGGAMAVTVLAMLIAAVGVFGGSDLRALLAQHPHSGPAVQRILSAIRHEVLKHNTMVLTGVVEAIDAGEDASDAAQHVRRTLFGPPRGEEPAGSGRADAGVYAQLKRYVRELEQIGRARGVRLNLRRRDPALSALLSGFKVLRGSVGLLDRAEQLGPRERRKLRDRLSEAARLLNTDGYEAVRALLDEMRALNVDARLLHEIHSRTGREPAFARVDVAPLQLDAEASLPCGVLLPRQAFEDIIANLIRNAIASTARHTAHGGPIEVGVGVCLELDAITGLERVIFEIRDRSPQEITTEMLRGRYIEEGLGLTADLVTRYEGTLEVMAECSSWAKAVVVKLPRAETAERTA